MLTSRLASRSRRGGGVSRGTDGDARTDARRGCGATSRRQVPGLQAGPRPRRGTAVQSVLRGSAGVGERFLSFSQAVFILCRVVSSSSFSW